MATLKTIRKRILSVRNTQKITKAMKMVAAAKLRRAQQALMQARPYGQHLRSVLHRLAAQIPKTHSIFQQPDSSVPVRILTLNSDRGLCGGFNSNLLRKIYYFLNGELDRSFELCVLGRKGRDFFKAKKIPVFEDLSGQAGMGFEKSLGFACSILEAYQSGRISGFYLAYNGFKSAISQEVRIRSLLPLRASESSIEETLLPVVYQPSVVELFDALLPKFLASEIYLAMLESQTSELGARMSAMENATNNAKEMIGRLTLQYNRARQASITKELMDIVNGAEALK